jgi:hypothetical protein
MSDPALPDASESIIYTVVALSVLLVSVTVPLAFRSRVAPGRCKWLWLLPLGCVRLDRPVDPAAAPSRAIASSARSRGSLLNLRAKWSARRKIGVGRETAVLVHFIPKV